MREVIDAIYKELNAELETAKDVKPFKIPDIEPELIPLILRDLTEEETQVISLRIRKNHELAKMYMRVSILNAIDDFESIDESLEADEKLRFKTELLDTLFFWYIAESTKWKFCTVIQRLHEGKAVLIGLNAAESRKFFESQKKKEGVKPGGVLEVPSTSTLVN